MEKMEIVFKSVGYMETPIKDTDNAPRQGQFEETPVEGTVVIDDEYLEALEGLEAGQKLDIIWNFHKTDKTVMKAKPRVSKVLKGVFATRSPSRPNKIAVTTVTIKSIKGTRIEVSGCDMLDGSPILDIKPSLTK